MKLTKDKRLICAIIAITITSLLSTAVFGNNVPFACFADGEVFHADGTPVDPGVKVLIVNQETGEKIETTTGYPNYPPVEQYNNDYKSVFLCKSGIDKISIKAWNNTHYGYAEMIVPEDSQALMNITLSKEQGKEEGWIIQTYKKLISYFIRNNR